MKMNIKTENRNFKEIIVWKYFIRMLMDILTMLLIIAMAIAIPIIFHRKWETYCMFFGQRTMIIVSLVIAITLLTRLLGSIDSIYTILTSNLLTKLRYIGDDPKLAYFTGKNE